MSTFHINSSEFVGLNRTESYTKLRQLHQQAMALGRDTHVIYESGISLNINFPATGEQKIMLTDYTDFNGAQITITSDRVNPIYIFALCQDERTVCKYISKRVIDSGDYTKEEELASGTKLLVIKDNTRWVKRNSYSYSPQRRDVVLIKDGIAQNKTIQPYSTRMSTPQCFYYDVYENQKVFKNGTFVRSTPTNKFFLLEIGLQNNVLVDNISVQTTVPSGMTEDMCFRIKDSTNVTFNDVTINGTYSAYDAYGYGIYMDNVCNSEFDNLQVTNAAWGVFGNINVNIVRLNGGSLNRFDVHCYGADITCTDVTFQNTISNGVRYNQLTCVYGQVLFESCIFKSFTPVVFDSTYNAYVPMDVIFRECTLDWSSGTPAFSGLVSAYGLFNYGENPREELKKKCLPNIIIRELTLKLPQNTTEYTLTLYHCGGSNLVPIEYLSIIDISKISVVPSIQTLNVKASSMPFSATNSIFEREPTKFIVIGASKNWQNNITRPTSAMPAPVFWDENEGFD